MSYRCVCRVNIREANRADRQPRAIATSLLRIYCLALVTLPGARHLSYSGCFPLDFSSVQAQPPPLRLPPTTYHQPPTTDHHTTKDRFQPFSAETINTERSYIQPPLLLRLASTSDPHLTSDRQTQHRILLPLQRRRPSFPATSVSSPL